MSFIVQILYVFVSVMMLLMFGRAILSWFIKDRSNPLVRFLHDVTEPMLVPVRGLLNNLGFGGGMIDFSFIIVYLILISLQSLLAGMM